VKEGSVATAHPTASRSPSTTVGSCPANVEGNLSALVGPRLRCRSVSHTDRRCLIELRLKADIPREQFPRSILARMLRVLGVSARMPRGRNEETAPVEFKLIDVRWEAAVMDTE